MMTRDMARTRTTETSDLKCGRCGKVLRWENGCLFCEKSVIDMGDQEVYGMSFVVGFLMSFVVGFLIGAIVLVFIVVVPPPSHYIGTVEAIYNNSPSYIQFTTGVKYNGDLNNVINLSVGRVCDLVVVQNSFSVDFVRGACK